MSPYLVMHYGPVGRGFKRQILLDRGHGSRAKLIQ
jgi:hypothetical protein